MSAAGGGGGTPLKVLFQVLGLEEAKAGITSLIPEIQKVGAAAEETGSRMGVLGEALQQSGDSAEALKPVADNLTAIEAANEAATTSTEALTEATDAEIASMEELTTLTDTHVESVDKLVTSEEALVTAEEEAVTVTDKLKTSTEGVVTTTDEAVESTKKATTSQDGLSTSTTKTTGALDKEKTSIKGVAGEAQKGTQNMKQLGDATEQEGQAAAGADQKNQSLRSSFTMLMGSATALTGGVISLWNSFDSLGDAQLNLDKANLKLSSASEAVSVAQAKVNELVAAGKTGTAEHSAAVLNLNQALEKEKIAQENVTNAQEGLNLANAEFYQNIGPEMLAIFGSLATMIETTRTTGGLFTKGLGEMKKIGVDTFIKLRYGVFSFGAAFKTITMKNPLLLVLTALGLAMTAFITNVGGVRNAINGIGVAIGNAIGPLKPMLTILGEIGQMAVDMLGMGGDSMDAFADTSEQSMGLATGAIEGNATAMTDWGNKNTTILRNADGTVAGFTTDFTTNMATAGNAMPGLSTAVGTAVVSSAKSLLLLQKDAFDTAQKLRETFTKAFDLNGIKVSGLGQEFTKQKLGTGKERDQTVEGGKGKKWSDLGLDIATDNMGKAYINAQKLEAALKALGLTETEIDANTKKLGESFDIVGLSMDTDVSGATELQAAATALNPEIAALEKQEKALATTQTGTAGTTQGMTDALGNVIPVLGKTNAALTETSAGGKKLTEMYGTVGEEMTAYAEIVGNANALEEVRAEGVKKQTTEMDKNIVALNEQIGAVGEYSNQLNTSKGIALEFGKGFVDQIDKLNQAKAAMYQNQGALAALSDTTVMADAKNVAYQDGIFTTLLALKNQQIATEGVRGETEGYIQALASGEAQQTAYNKGLAEQERQVKLDTIANEELKGQLKGLQDQWASGESQLVSFNNGVINQAIAFENQKKAIANTIGTVAQLRQEYASGDGVLQSYNQGLADTALAFEEQKLSLNNMHATLVQTQKQYTDFGGAMVNFSQGMMQARIEMVEQKKANDQMSGAIAALIISIAQGDAGIRAYREGWNESTKTFLDSINATDKLRGSIDSMSQRMDAERVHAFGTGILEMTKSMVDADIATANTYGQIEKLQSTLTKGSDIMARFDKGFADSYKSVVEWATGMDTAKGSAEGSAQAFAEMQQTLGVELPEGYNLSQEAAQEWIEVQQGVPDTINGIVEAAKSAGDALSSSLVEGFRGGQDKLDEEFDKLEEKLGVELTDAMKDALKPGIFAQSTKEYLDAEFSALQAMEPGTEGWVQMADSMMVKMAEAIETSPHLATAATNIANALQAVKMDPTNTQKLADLALAIQNYGTQAGGAVKPATELNAAAANSTGITAQGQALSSSAKFMLAYNEAVAAGKSANEAVAAGSAAAAEALKTTGTEAGTAATATGTAAEKGDLLGEAFVTTGTKLQSFVDVMKLLPAGVKQQVGLMNTEFNAINPVGTTFTTNMGIFAEILKAMPGETKTAVDGTNTAFGALNPMQPAYVASMGAIVSQLGLLPGAVTQQVGAANTAFGGLNPVGTTFTTNWNNMANMLASLQTVVTQAVTPANTAFGTLNPMGTTFMTNWNNMANLLNSFQTVVSQTVTPANTAFGTLNPMQPAYVNSMNAIVAQIGLLPGAVLEKVTEANTNFGALNPLGQTWTSNIIILTQRLGTLPTDVLNAVTSANTNFGTLNPISETFNTAWGNLAIMLDGLQAVVTQTMGKANTAFGTLNPIQPTYVTGMDAIVAQLGLFPGAVSQQVGKANAEFNKLNPVSPRFQAEWGSIGTMMPTLATLAGMVVGKTNQAFAQIKPIQPQFQSQWANIGKMLPTLAQLTAQVVTKVNQSWNQMAQASGKAFTMLTTQSRTASSQVGVALQSMATKAQATFRTISSSASGAVSGVKSLASAINALKSKTVTITTIYRRVVQTVAAAKGFGPAIVNSPMNMLVGEAGRELVSVIPLDNNKGGGGADQAAGGSSVSTMSSMSKVANVSNNRNSSMFSSLANNSAQSNISESTINRFNEAVSNITSSFEKQNSVMNSSFVTGINSSASSVRGGSYFSNATAMGGNTVSNNSTNIPHVSTVNHGGNVYNEGGGVIGGGTNTDSIVRAIKEAFFGTTINLNNTTNIDGDKVYEAQKRQFGLRNGAMLK